MFPNSFKRVNNVTALLFLVGFLGHQFFFQVQENFYGQENGLKAVFTTLGFLQLSMTSYFGFLSWTALILQAFLFLTGEEFFRRSVAVFLLYMIPVVCLGLHTLYEIRQAINPSYPDNFLADAMLGVLACVTYLVALSWAHRPLR